MTGSQKNETDHFDVLLIYGSEFGWVDVENLQRYLEAHSCRDCWVYIQTAPVERVQRALEEDERIQLRVTDTPKKAAKAFYQELHSGEKRAELKSLEKVSDRSMHKGAC